MTDRLIGYHLVLQKLDFRFLLLGYLQMSSRFIQIELSVIAVAKEKWAK